MFKNKNNKMVNVISYFVFIFRLFKIRFFPPPEFSKQLLDEIFVTSRVIKVEVSVISCSQRLRLITLTKTLITLEITHTQIVFIYIERN